jgi:hypothetical protein
MVNSTLALLILTKEFGWEEEEVVDEEKTVSKIMSWSQASEEGLQQLNDYFEEHSYVLGYVPGAHDYELLAYS